MNTESLSITLNTAQLTADIQLLSRGLFAFDAGKIDLAPIESGYAKETLDRVRLGDFDKFCADLVSDLHSQTEGDANELIMVARFPTPLGELLSAFRAAGV